jgi:hypothetical protein
MRWRRGCWWSTYQICDWRHLRCGHCRTFADGDWSGCGERRDRRTRRRNLKIGRNILRDQFCRRRFRQMGLLLRGFVRGCMQLLRLMRLSQRSNRQVGWVDGKHAVSWRGKRMVHGRAQRSKRTVYRRECAIGRKSRQEKVFSGENERERCGEVSARTGFTQSA